MTLTPYTVDNEWWLRRSMSVDRDAVRAKWGAGAEDLVVLFCAKLQSWKRPLDLLRAFSQTDFTKALLIVAGEGPQHSELQAEALCLGIASRVRFLGFVNQSQLPPLYTSADVMVLPSGYEPFAVVVNEAMCCACPVISSDRWAQRRLDRSHISGIDLSLRRYCGLGRNFEINFRATHRVKGAGECRARTHEIVVAVTECGGDGGSGSNGSLRDGKLGNKSFRRSSSRIHFRKSRQWIFVATATRPRNCEPRA